METYSFQFCGDCLGALTPNGTQVLVDPVRAWIQPGRYCCNPAQPRAWTLRQLHQRHWGKRFHGYLQDLPWQA